MGCQRTSCVPELKDLLCTVTVLAHFDPAKQIGISCDASNVGIGAVLFHRYDDGSERPIANVSKTLTDTQRRYSQIQRSSSVHLRTKEVSIKPLRKKLQFSHRPQTTGYASGAYQRDAYISCQSTG